MSDDERTGRSASTTWAWVYPAYCGYSSGESRTPVASSARAALTRFLTSEYDWDTREETEAIKFPLASSGSRMMANSTSE